MAVRSAKGADTAAILVAGGQGRRFGAGLPRGRARVRKQYLTLKGRPLLWWSAAAFQKCPSVGAIVLVVPPGDVSRIQARAKAWRLSKLAAVVAGGPERRDSVRLGLAACPACRIVAVHDAVRPLVTPGLIEKVIQAARMHKAAIAACPSRDTVKLSDHRLRVRTSPPRERVWLAQTPQVFERKLLERAHNIESRVPSPESRVGPITFRGAGPRTRDSGLETFTDDAQMVERLGVTVRLVEAPAENIKVTVPWDFKIARLALKGR